MSSSDSDDDCYGNAAKRLQSLKKTYMPEKFDDVCHKSHSLFGVSKTPKSECDLITKYLPSSSIVLDDSNASLNNTEEELSLETIIANNTKPKRGRKRKEVDDTYEPNERVTRSRGKIVTRQGNNSLGTNESPSQSNSSESSNRRGGKKSRGNNLETSSRGRGSNRRPRIARGRGRRGRGSRSYLSLNQTQENIYPTYSIGDFGIYPDMCHNQELFSSKTTNETETIDKDDPLENDNEEISVKVYWQSTKVFRFKIRRYQKLTQIFKYFTEKENIDDCKLLLMYKDSIIKADDTPDTINYNIAEFIDGGIVNSDVTGLVKHNLNTIESNNGFKIKFQCQILKEPFEMIVKQDDKLATAMTLCAEHLEQPLEKLKFYFDGDLISNKKTPQELGLETGDCIDVKIIS